MKAMKGFIEVHTLEPKNAELVAVSEITRVSGSVLVLKEMGTITCKESYEKIKKLIKEATK